MVNRPVFFVFFRPPFIVCPTPSQKGELKEGKSGGDKKVKLCAKMKKKKKRKPQGSQYSSPDRRAVRCHEEGDNCPVTRQSITESKRIHPLPNITRSRDPGDNLLQTVWLCWVSG